MNSDEELYDDELKEYGDGFDPDNDFNSSVANPEDFSGMHTVGPTDTLGISDEGLLEEMPEELTPAPMKQKNAPAKSIHKAKNKTQVVTKKTKKKK
ncbi:MAG: hypothetical protein QM526_00110 [Alphaproteobacteria bacterium]|nr:hypothetical protein [Alphaproteobacteria bacterium]